MIDDDTEDEDFYSPYDDWDDEENDHPYQQEYNIFDDYENILSKLDLGIHSDISYQDIDNAIEDWMMNNIPKST